MKEKQTYYWRKKLCKKSSIDTKDVIAEKKKDSKRTKQKETFFTDIKTSWTKKTRRNKERERKMMGVWLQVMGYRIIFNPKKSASSVEM